MKYLKTIIMCAAAVGLVCAAAQTAHAEFLGKCGERIVPLGEDLTITLTQDIVDCPDVGLYIERGDRVSVTLDCAGHQIRGPSIFNGLGNTGILIDTTADVTIMNCILGNFEVAAIEMREVSNVAILENTLKNNGTGIRLIGGDYVTIKSNVFSDNQKYDLLIEYPCMSPTCSVYNNMFTLDKIVAYKLPEFPMFWNTKPIEGNGPNIVGGELIGGNFILGYSDTVDCFPGELPSFCAKGLVMPDGGSDYYPLAPVVIVPPVVEAALDAQATLNELVPVPDNSQVVMVETAQELVSAAEAVELETDAVKIVTISSRYVGKAEMMKRQAEAKLDSIELRDKYDAVQKEFEKKKAAALEEVRAK